MKFVITGAAGNISRPLALRLLKEGHTVTVIGRNAAHLKELAEMGAHIEIGSVGDPVIINKAFKGSDAVYTMCPPDVTVSNLSRFCENIATNYAESIAMNKIRHVVNLSSVGAHLLKGAGHITGMQKAEAVLNQLENVNVLHLRPVYFLTNLFGQIELIKSMGIMGANFSVSAKRFPVVHPHDIAAVAADELLTLDFPRHSVRYIASDETGTDEIASVLGKAIGKPDLKWTRFTDEQFSQGLLQAGFSKEIIPEFVEGFNALNSGKLFEDYWLHRPEELGVTTLADFAKLFESVYNSKQKILNEA